MVLGVDYFSWFFFLFLLLFFTWCVFHSLSLVRPFGISFGWPSIQFARCKRVWMLQVWRNYPSTFYRRREYFYDPQMTKYGHIIGFTIDFVALSVCVCEQPTIRSIVNGQKRVFFSFSFRCRCCFRLLFFHFVLRLNTLTNAPSHSPSRAKMTWKRKNKRHWQVLANGFRCLKTTAECHVNVCSNWHRSQRIEYSTRMGFWWNICFSFDFGKWSNWHKEQQQQ